MGFAPAAPEAVLAGATIADLIVALAALLAALVCYGLLFGYTYTLGFLLDKLAAILSFRVLGHTVNLGAPISKLDNAIQGALAAGVSTAQHAAGLFFHWAAVMLTWMVTLAARMAEDTLHLANWLVNIHLPKYVKAALYALFPPALLYRLIHGQATKTIPQVKHIAKAAAKAATTVVYKPVKVFERRLTKAEKVIAALAATVAGIAGTLHIPHHIATPADVWRGLTRRTARLERRLHRVEGLFAAGVLAAAIANVLGITARCLRKGNVGKAARSVCGMDASLLEDLLLGTVGIVGGLSIVEFATELRAVEDEAVGVAAKLIREWPS